jgi:hypothetical protein
MLKTVFPVKNGNGISKIFYSHLVNRYITKIVLVLDIFHRVEVQGSRFRVQGSEVNYFAIFFHLFAFKFGTSSLPARSCLAVAGEAVS